MGEVETVRGKNVGGEVSPKIMQINSKMCVHFRT
jgi:hypothetical protein